jgi:hypothetical protein
MGALMGVDSPVITEVSELVEPLVVDFLFQWDFAIAFASVHFLCYHTLSLKVPLSV